MSCPGCSKPELVQSFEIDGKLWSKSREECFTLGVEWGIVWTKLQRPEPFVHTIHIDNLERIMSALTDFKRTCVVVHPSPGWVTLQVAGLE